MFSVALLLLNGLIIHQTHGASENPVKPLFHAGLKNNSVLLNDVLYEKVLNFVDTRMFNFMVKQFIEQQLHKNVAEPICTSKLNGDYIICQNKQVQKIYVEFKVFSFVLSKCKVFCDHFFIVLIFFSHIAFIMAKKIRGCVWLFGLITHATV